MARGSAGWPGGLGLVQHRMRCLHGGFHGARACGGEAGGRLRDPRDEKRAHGQADNNSPSALLLSVWLQRAEHVTPHSAQTARQPVSGVPSATPICLFAAAGYHRVEMFGSCRFVHRALLWALSLRGAIAWRRVRVCDRSDGVLG